MKPIRSPFQKLTKFFTLLGENKGTINSLLYYVKIRRKAETFEDYVNSESIRKKLYKLAEKNVKINWDEMTFLDENEKKILKKFFLSKEKEREEYIHKTETNETIKKKIDSQKETIKNNNQIVEILISCALTHYEPDTLSEELENLFKEENISLEPKILADFIIKFKNLIQDTSNERVKHLQKALDKLKKEYISKERLFNMIKDSIVTVVPPKANINIKKEGKDKETPILLISDCHIGEEVNLPFSKYNIEIAEKMANFIAETAIKLIKQRLNSSYYDEIFIFFLGDIISGTIHEELVKYSIEATKQVIKSAYILAGLVNTISSMGNIKAFCVVGNHGRLKKEVSYKSKWDNWDYLVYNFMKEILRNNKRVEMHIPESPFAVVNVSGFNFLLHHGDNIRSYLGIPYYGLNRADNSYVVSFLKAEEIIINYIVRGHFHSATILQAPFGETIINGSWKGADEYVFENFKTYSEPQQWMLWVHEKRGLVWRTPIKLVEFIR